MYAALVTSIKTAPHPNADRLAIGNCCGFQVVIGIDTSDNALGVFFPCDGQLSPAYCEANDLYPRFDASGGRVGGGFIDPKNNRVRAQNFRGVNSEGLWMPLSSLDSFGKTSTLQEGDTFTSYNGVEICSKWFNKATKAAMGKKGKDNRKETPWLLMHPDTPQLKYNANQLLPGTQIHITEKIHGTSQRTSMTWEPVLEPLFKFLRPLMHFEWLRGLITYDTGDYVCINGTRRVLVDSFTDGTGYYTSNSFRKVHEDFLRKSLGKGFQIYYEVAGYVHGDSLIMPECDNSKVSKAFAKQWGKTTRFTYGCKPGESRMYAYALTYTDKSGKRTQYNYPEMAALCHQWGVPVVPLLRSLVVETDTDVKAIADMYTSGTSTVDASHIREGVCLEIKDPISGKITWMKNKSQEFYILEDVIKSGDAVDIEEVESY